MAALLGSIDAATGGTGMDNDTNITDDGKGRFVDPQAVAIQTLLDETQAGGLNRANFTVYRQQHPNREAAYTAVEARAAIAVAAKRAESRNRSLQLMKGVATKAASKITNLRTMIYNMCADGYEVWFKSYDCDGPDVAEALDSFEWEGGEDCNVIRVRQHLMDTLPGLKLARERAEARDPFDRGDAPSGADNTELSHGRAVEAREWNGGRR